MKVRRCRLYAAIWRESKKTAGVCNFDIFANGIYIECQLVFLSNSDCNCLITSIMTPSIPCMHCPAGGRHREARGARVHARMWGVFKFGSQRDLKLTVGRTGAEASR